MLRGMRAGSFFVMCAGSPTGQCHHLDDPICIGVIALRHGTKAGRGNPHAGVFVVE